MTAHSRHSDLLEGFHSALQGLKCAIEAAAEPQLDVRERKSRIEHLRSQSSAMAATALIAQLIESADETDAMRAALASDWEALDASFERLQGRPGFKEVRSATRDFVRFLSEALEIYRDAALRMRLRAAKGEPHRRGPPYDTVEDALAHLRRLGGG